ncbi:Ras GTPase [Aspergillus pseudonomiae]
MASRMVMYKLVMLGDSGVGKTALMMQMSLRFFVETVCQYDPTTEDEFRQQVVVDGQSCMMDVLDTGGGMKQTALIDQWIRDGEGFILVYSISSRSSFIRIKELHHHIQRLKEPFTSSARQALSATSLQPPMPIILVGNKCDIDTGRTVSVEEGYALARELGCRFVEASAKNNINVEAAFLDVVRILQRGRQQALRQATSSSDRLSQRRAAISRSVSDVSMSITRLLSLGRKQPTSHRPGIVETIFESQATGVNDREQLRTRFDRRGRPEE